MKSCLNCSQRNQNAFCHLGEDAMRFLESVSTSAERPRGATFFRQGDQCEAVYILCSGRAKLSTISREGRTMILRIADPGYVLGLSAMLSEGVHQVTVEALEPCHVKVINRRALMEMLQRYGEASVGVAKALASECCSGFDEVRRIGLPTSPAGRVARLLLDWTEGKAKSLNAKVSVAMPLTHEELASMTATSRETVTRTLSRFRRENLISIKGISLTVLQPDALEQLSAC
ncbi:Crp/Fnr family transcriptional regulator [Edaphobacter sp. 12200R-103]|nr:Crp/Fnr family transcriptional regulator [Edaphobacter sp. 12200R-103]